MALFRQVMERSCDGLCLRRELVKCLLHFGELLRINNLSELSRVDTLRLKQRQLILEVLGPILQLLADPAATGAK